MHPSRLEIRKQISIFVPLSDWRIIRQEAARLRIPITELCRRWMRPGIVALRTSQRPLGAFDPDDAEEERDARAG